MNPVFKNKTVLVVDDDVDLLAQMEIRLSKEGFNVVAVDGQENAEKYLLANQPDVVISDLMMEAIDGGFSLTHFAKKRNPKVPVIIVTGATQDTGMSFTNAAQVIHQADLMLNKPVNYDQLMKEIERLMTEEL